MSDHDAIWMVFGLVALALAYMWYTAFATRRRLIRENKWHGPYLKQVYTAVAFTVADLIMFAAYLTPSQF